MADGTAVAKLKPGTRRSPGHPWVFDGDIASVDPDPGPGGLVRVVGAGGEPVGWGFWGPRSRVRVRLLVGGGGEPGGLEELLRSRIAAAVAARAALGRGSPRDAVRVVHGESDGLPGLVADRYASAVVVQLLSAGMDRLRDTVVRLLAEATGASAVVERSETGGREREGLPPARGVLAGSLPPGGLVPFTAGGLELAADVLGGQKTGFYLDQRDSWEALRPLGSGRSILDVCCYTGAFGLSLLAGGGTSLTGVDSSERAVGIARDLAGRNGLAGRAGFVHGDAGGTMASLAAKGRRFGFVVLDPSAFARARAHAGMARRAYAALNEAALRLVEPGGFLFSCSCTPWVGREPLIRIISAAARGAGREVRLVEARGASRDHPVHPAMPETEYLSALLWYCG